MSQSLPHIVCIIGPTGSGKSARAIDEALTRNGEIISADSRQIFRGLDIGTEKMSIDDRKGIPHHLIDIREPSETYSAGEFAHDADALIADIIARGKLPIIVGGTHFYIDALVYGLPDHVDISPALRAKLEQLTDDDLFERIEKADPERAKVLDPRNRRRLIRALEIIETRGRVSPRVLTPRYDVEWITLEPEAKSHRATLRTRLENAFNRGLIDEVAHIRSQVGDHRLNELGLEYKIVGEYLRSERSRDTLVDDLTAKLWQYARRQRAWIRKIRMMRSTTYPALR